MPKEDGDSSTITLLSGEIEIISDLRPLDTSERAAARPPPLVPKIVAVAVGALLAGACLVAAWDPSLRAKLAGSPAETPRPSTPVTIAPVAARPPSMPSPKKPAPLPVEEPAPIVATPAPPPAKTAAPAPPVHAPVTKPAPKVAAHAPASRTDQKKARTAAPKK
jgi:hypothetical protein